MRHLCGQQVSSTRIQGVTHAGRLYAATLDVGLSGANDELVFGDLGSYSTILSAGGDDTLLFEGVVGGASIDAGLGADRLVFLTTADAIISGLKSANEFVSFGAGAVSALFADSVLTRSSIYGGSNNDSLVFNANINANVDASMALDPGEFNAIALDAGAGSDTLVFRGSFFGSLSSLYNNHEFVSFSGSGATVSFTSEIGSGSTIQSGSFDDWMRFEGSINGATLDVGAGNDTINLLASDNVVSGSRIVLGVGQDFLHSTQAFSAVTLDAGQDADTLILSRFSGSISGLFSMAEQVVVQGGATAVFASDIGANSTIQLQSFAAVKADFLGAIHEATSINLGYTNDAVTFAAGISAAQVKMNSGDDTLVFHAVTLAGASLSGGSGADRFSGNIAGVGAGGVSFWGNAGNDSFNFSQISTGANTAYFWNTADHDFISFGSEVSATSGLANVRIGVTQGATSSVSFLATQSLLAPVFTSLFAVASDTVALAVSAAVGIDQVTLVFGHAADVTDGSGIASIMLLGSEVEGITQAFGLTAGSASFNGGIAMPVFS
jgi:hypothetical protein